ncbi:MAG: hypothetical protein ABIR26_04475, partial [Ramlibacter sp.]
MSDAATTPRYAVYYAPRCGSAWWRFGTKWLGRDEGDDLRMEQQPLARIGPEELARITEDPRRYGF